MPIFRSRIRFLMGKKATIALLAAFSLMLVSQASGQTFDWANNAGRVPTSSTGGLETEAIAVDSGGGNYFVGSSDADTLIFANDTVTTNFGFFSRLNNLVIGKYSTNGKPLWGYSPTPLHNNGVSGDDIAYYKGHLYVTGGFGDTVAFTKTDTLVNNIRDEGSAFVMKLDTTGVVEWVVENDTTDSRCIGVNGSTVAIGGQTDSNRHFFATYDTTGTLLKEKISQANPANTNRLTYVRGIGVDSSENIIAVGGFSDTLKFGTTSLGRFSGVNNNYDGFILKFDKNLNLQWMDRLGDGSNTGLEGVRGVHVEESGLFYATGVYNNTLNYRSNSYSGTGSGASGFVGEFKSNGTLNWLKRITTGSFGDAEGKGVSTTQDSVFLTGYFSGSKATFGSKSAQNTGGGDNAFITKLDKQGNFEYIYNTGNVRGRGKDVGVDSNKAGYITGESGGLTFGNKTTSIGGNFVTKLSIQSIKLDSLPDTTYCPGDSIQPSFTVKGQFDTGNTFTAQLSDSSGSFKTPTILDSVKGTKGDTIRTTLPESIPPGSNYRVRIVSDAPPVISNLNPATLEIKKPPTLSLTAPRVTCGTDSVKPNVTTNANTFQWSPVAYVSDSVAKAPWLRVLPTKVFTLKAYDSSGCVAKDTANVQINSKPPLPNSSNLFKRFGDSLREEGKTVLKTCNGELIIGGYTESYGLSNSKSPFLMRLGNNDSVEWMKTFENANPFRDLLKTLDGNYLGVTTKTQNSSTVGNGEGLLMKFNNLGDTIWTKNFGYGLGTTEALTKLSDGSILVAGESEKFVNSCLIAGNCETVWLTKFDQNGNLKWSKYYQDSSLLNWDQTRDVITSSGDTTYVLGDYHILKIDGSGNRIWLKKLSLRSNFYGIDVTPSGDLVICGSLSGYPRTIRVIKVTRSGKVKWAKDLQSSGLLSNDQGEAIEALSDSNILVAGRSEYRGRNKEDAYIAILDQTGRKIWETGLGGRYNSIYNFFDLTATGTDNIVAVGQTGSFTNTSFSATNDISVIKTDTTSSIQCANGPSLSVKSLNNVSLNTIKGNDTTNTPPTFPSNIKVKADTPFEKELCGSIEADFAYKDTCLGATTKFFDSTFQDSLSSYSWNWNFGDPNTGSKNTTNQQNPTHVFSRADTFDVQLIASTGTYQDSITKQVIIKKSSLSVKAQPQDTLLCPDDSVQLTVSDTTLRSYEWRPGNRVGDSTIAEPYAYPGQDTLVLTVQDSAGCINRDSITIKEKPDNPRAPSLRKLNTQSTSSIKVQWDTPDSFANFKRYVVYRKPANQQTFSAVDSIPAFGSTSLLDQTVSATDSLTYDYFIRAQNSCGTLSDTSNTLRSIALKRNTLSDKKLQVKWNPSLFDDSVKYEVKFDPGSGFRLDSTFFKDTAYQRIACDNSGMYEITAIDTATNDTVISNRISPAVKDTTPPPAGLLSASRFGLGQEPTYGLTLDQSDSGDFKESVIFQSVNKGAYQALDTLGNANGVINTYSKPAYPDSNNVCFRIQPTDTCGNQGPRSSPHCLIDLEGRPGNKENQLLWTPYKGFQADTVEVQRFQNGSWQNLAYLAGSDTTYRHQDLTCRDTFQYRIKYQEAGGNGQISYSDSIQLSPFDTTQPAVPEIKYASFNFNFNGLANLAFEPLSANVDRYIVRVEGQNGQPQRSDTIYGSSDTTYRDAYADPIEEVKCYTIQAQNVTCDSVYTTESKAHCLPLLQAEKIRCTPAVRLSWTPYQGFDSFGGYDIGIKADSISGIDTLGKVSQGTTSFIHRDADTGVTYQYQVRVRDGSIFPLEPVSSTAVLVNKPALPEPPTVLGASKVATDNTNGQVKLNWQTFTDKQGLDHFKLYHKPSSQNQFSVLKSSIPLTQDSFIHKGLNTRSRNHQYYLTTEDSCGRESDSTRVQTTINLSLTVKELRHELQWTPYKGFEVERVKIQRAFGDGAFNTIGSQSIFTSLGTSFIDTNVRCGEQYSYRIKALGPEGALAFSDTVTGTAFDNTPPDRPDLHRASVSFTDNTGGQIELRYRGAPQANTKGYTIARKAASSSGFRVIDSFRLNGIDSLTYTDDPVNTYTQAQNYYLKAYDRCGNISLPSDTHRTINLSADPANGYIQLSWNAYFGWGFRTYKLQRKESLNSWETIQDLETGDLSYRDSQVICNNIYQYRIIGEERTTGYRSFSNTDTAKAYEINPPLPPQIRRVSVTTTSQTNGATLLTWNPSLTANTLRSVLYRKGQNQDTYRPIDTVERYRYRDSPVNTTGQYYDYRLKAIDQCLVPSDSFSPAHRSIHLTATGGNEQIRLDWNAYRGDEVRAYKVLRGQEVLTSTAPGRTSLVDEQVTCDTTYQYQIKAVLEGGTRVSLSNRDQARSIHNKGPKPPYLQRATVTSFNDVVEVKWKPSDAYTVKGYEVFREQGSRLSKIAQINDPDRTFTTDSFAIPEQQSVCYYVRALDACGNESELSNRGCLIQPTAEALDLENRVFWPAYRKWEEGVRAYEVFKQLANGSYTAFANLDSNARQYPDQALRDSADQFCYYVRAEGFGEETYSRSTRVCLEQSAVVYIPNTFSPGVTPNTNDQFGPEGLYIDNYEMQIYNRWGEQVFSTSTSEEWDGTYRGELVPQGVYLYSITIIGENGKRESYEGSLNVVK